MRQECGKDKKQVVDASGCSGGLIRSVSTHMDFTNEKVEL